MLSLPLLRYNIGERTEMMGISRIITILLSSSHREDRKILLGVNVATIISTLFCQTLTNYVAHIKFLHFLHLC